LICNHGVAGSSPAAGTNVQRQAVILNGFIPTRWFATWHSEYFSGTAPLSHCYSTGISQNRPGNAQIIRISSTEPTSQ
jgi:hypothetical protein